jgi:hypothetical protein
MIDRQNTRPREGSQHSIDFSRLENSQIRARELDIETREVASSENAKRKVNIASRVL